MTTTRGAAAATPTPTRHPSRKRSYPCSMTPEMWAAITAVAAAQDRYTSQIVRDAIRLYFRWHNLPLDESGDRKAGDPHGRDPERPIELSA